MKVYRRPQVGANALIQMALLELSDPAWELDVFFLDLATEAADLEDEEIWDLRQLLLGTAAS